MTLFLTKIGLYERGGVESDIPLGSYKPLEYTQDENNYLNSIFSAPFLKLTLSSETKIKIKNGVLTVGRNNYNISSYIIEDVINILIKEGIEVSLIRDYESFRILPAFFITETSNEIILTETLESSPKTLERDYKEKFKGLTPVEVKEKYIKVFRDSTNEPYKKEASFEVQDDKIYLEIEEGLILTRSVISTSFYLHIDFNLKVLRDAREVSKLITYQRKEAGPNEEDY